MVQEEFEIGVEYAIGSRTPRREFRRIGVDLFGEFLSSTEQLDLVSY